MNLMLALTRVAAFGVLGLAIGWVLDGPPARAAVILDIVIGLAIGIAITGLIVRLMPWHGRPPTPRLPRMRISRIADPKLDIGLALKRGDRTWRP